MFAGISPQALVIGLAVVWCGACALQAARAWPIAMRRALQGLTERVREAENGLEAVQAKLAAKIVELGALAEEVEGMLESVERKRRRIAAATSAARHDEPVVDEREATLAALKSRARSAGWPI